MYRKASILTILIIAVITAFMGWRASQLGFDYNFETFFPKDDPATRKFLEHRDQFITDNDYVLIAIQNEKGIFQKDFLAKVDQLTQQIEAESWAEYVISPTNLTFPVKDPLFGMLNDIPYLHFDKPRKYESDSTRIYNSPELVDSYFSGDGKSILIYIRHTAKLPENGCRGLAANTNEILAEFEFDEHHVAGRCDAQVYYIDLMQTELIVFVGASILLIVLFLFLSYRSFWGVWVPAVVIITAVIWTLGVMELTGKKIDMILSILPTIMFVIGLSDAIHLISKYLEELRNGKSQVEAITIAYKEVGLATFFTSLTTAIGFLTLLTSSIMPIIDLGIYVACGVVIALVLTYTLMPAIILLTKPLKVAEVENKETFWYGTLHGLLRWIIRNKRLSVAGFAVILLLSVFGCSRIILNNYLLEDLKEDNYLQQGFRFIENNFDGCRPYELAVWVEDSTKIIYDSDVLHRLEAIETYLQTEHELGFVISPVAIVKAANKAQHGGKQKFYKLPEKEKELSKIVKELKKLQKMAVVSSVVSDDLRKSRIAGRTADVGSYKLAELDAELTEYMKEHEGIIGFNITGTAHLIDINNSYISKNVLQGLLIAFAVIAFIVWLMFRSIKLVIFSLIVNILPLVMIGGVMGFLGIDLKMSTAIIFTIAFGIAVDDTIHFLSKLRHELRQGKSMFYAIKRSYLSTGKAIVVTSLILCGGFLTLALSDFLGTANIGILISLTLLFAVLSDLVLLPALLLIFPIRKKE
ncbi:MAG: MMPL family transporter [Flavobacteriales bacterium]|nr:MMPL family transporter [Flavobacteriales bacterium]